VRLSAQPQISDVSRCIVAALLHEICGFRRHSGRRWVLVIGWRVHWLTTVERVLSCIDGPSAKQDAADLGGAPTRPPPPGFDAAPLQLTRNFPQRQPRLRSSSTTGISGA
jgi:hypothetical protein